MRYVKQPLDFPDILAMLKGRGLVISDEDKAVSCLKAISYFRLANYFRPMEADKTTHVFKPNSHFESAVALYRFDQELRTLLFDTIQTIEVALRAKMIHHISLRYGAFWFADASLFNNASIFKSCLQHIRQEVERSREDFITEHIEKYSEPDMPPIWKSLEVTTFGTLSKLFANFGDNLLKKRIAREFNLPQHIVLENWIKCAAVMRNHLAHHTRVWNRNFPYIPQTNVPLRGPWLSHGVQHSHKLYPYVCCIQYLLNGLRPENTFPHDLTALLEKYPNVDAAAMGFPADWQKEPLWQ